MFTSNISGIWTSVTNGAVIGVEVTSEDHKLEEIRCLGEGPSPNRNAYIRSTDFV